MNKIVLTYIGDNNTRALEYTLLQHATVDKFLQVWEHVISNKDCFESDIEWHVPSYDAQHYTTLIYNICQTLTEQHGVVLPDGWQTPPYSNQYLNDLHEGFRVNQNDTDIEQYSQLLHDLNLHIHQLESFMYADQSGDVNPVIHSFMDFHNDYKLDFAESDGLLVDTNYRNKHCIFMAYETLGKTLENVVMDNDITILDNNVLMPKSKIGTQFSVCIPWSNFSTEYMMQLDTSYKHQITNWCTENNILSQYNVDYTAWQHQPGRVILATSSTTQDDWQWFVDQKYVSIKSIEFKTDKFNATISHLMEKTYEINQNISGQ